MCLEGPSNCPGCESWWKLAKVMGQCPSLRYKTPLLQNLTRLMAHHGQGSKPCPLCDAPTHPLMEHVLTQHHSDLGLSCISDLPLPPSVPVTPSSVPPTHSFPATAYTSPVCFRLDNCSHQNKLKQAVRLFIGKTSYSKLLQVEEIKCLHYAILPWLWYFMHI